ncbi:hypothetical protein A0H81_06764 [Grifola frondosa]|uniref:Uncharacterized protein n=1 Tax=Grifola frondosa TaxID=5627 RepID=A0A1C7M8R2_GRIFR|nr:hypothetical protein A0H81_06764 [Grifola frondosa]
MLLQLLWQNRPEPADLYAPSEHAPSSEDILRKASSILPMNQSPLQVHRGEHPTFSGESRCAHKKLTRLCRRAITQAARSKILHVLFQFISTFKQPSFVDRVFDNIHLTFSIC